MNNLPSYQTQFNKITEAYIRGEIKPYDACFCFCGTLADNKSDWCFSSIGGLHFDFMNYTGVEYVRMERALFNEIDEADPEADELECQQEYEDALFNGMVAALEVLKQIHIERGEVIDDAPVFQKRELQSQLS